MNTLSYIVATDNAISAVLHSGSGYQVQQLFDLYRTSPNKEEFVHVLCTRLLMESKRPSGKATRTSTPPLRRAIPTKQILCYPYYPPTNSMEADMASAYIQQLRQLFKSTKKAKDNDAQRARSALDAFAEKNKQFQENKERASNDIRRGSRQSRGKLPD